MKQSTCIWYSGIFSFLKATETRHLISDPSAFVLQILLRSAGSFTDPTSTSYGFVHVETIVVTPCPYDTTGAAGQQVNWQETKGGTTAEVNCAPGYSGNQYRDQYKSVSRALNS